MWVCFTILRDFGDNVNLYELINLKWKHGIIFLLLTVTQFNLFDFVSKLKDSYAIELISLVKLHVVKYETPYLPDGYMVTFNVHVYR